MSVFVAPRVAPPLKAGPIGPGAGVLQTEFPLEVYGFGASRSPQKRMEKAWAMSFEVDWIDRAEDAISERFAGVPWHLEDENDVTIDDAYANEDARAAHDLIEAPSRNLKVGAPFYRSDLWGLTSRAMGICGSGFIYLDNPEMLAGTPNAMLPVAPWRLTPADDPAGNLLGWFLDRTAQDPGMKLRLDQVLHYQLRRNFVGHFGVGLMEAAITKAQISTGLDRHVGMVLSAGGRLSGIISPQQGILENETMLQMERDWRTVVEQSDAAKRLQLIRGPIKFDRTTLTPQELQVVDLIKNSRDDLLALWGVPLSIIGGTTPAGLNSGDTRKYDEAAIWQGPVHHRLNVFRETTQYQLLDRWQGLGVTVELEIEEPEFDDDSPRYDLLLKSANTPMTNEQRLALIGLPPTNDLIFNRTIVLPVTMQTFAVLPPEGEEQATPTEQVLGRTPDQTVGGSDPATLAAGETSKATLRGAPLHASLVKLRASVERNATPLIRRSVAAVLTEQRHEIAERMRAHATHIAGRPRDVQKWWDGAKWNEKLAAAIRPHAVAMAESVASHIGSVLAPAKAGPVSAVDAVLLRGAARVGGINEVTRDKIIAALVRGTSNGLTVLEVADLIEGIGTEEAAAALGLDMGALFDDYRSEMIARTELMDAYRGASSGSYRDAGISEVQMIDGDGDPECAARDGQIVSLDEYDAIEDHPNGTLDAVPVKGKTSAQTPSPRTEKTAAFLEAMQRDETARRQELVGMVTAFTQAIQAQVEAPIDVHVAAPQVTVLPSMPQIIVQQAPRVDKRVVRDEQGRIVGLEES